MPLPHAMRPVPLAPRSTPHTSPPYLATPPGLLKEQIDTLVARFFAGFEGLDQEINFTAAVSTAMIQRKWRARSRAHKLKRKKVRRVCVWGGWGGRRG
jgi:hypothetical protein